MDEPTSALDPRSVLALMSEVRRLNEALGSAFLLVSHDLAAIAAVASRLVVLEQGCIVEMGAIEGCFAAPQSAALRTLIDASGLALGE
jgi:peptide/nickel transport system ATP-binding protein